MENVFSKDKAIDLFRQHATIKKYLPETTLIIQGNEVHELLLIESGVVKLTYLDENGDENLVTFCKKGTIIGVAGLVSQTGAIVTSTTINVCEIYRLEVPKFRRLEQDNPAFAQTINQFISQQYSDLVIYLSQLANAPVRTRLLRMILDFIAESNTHKSEKIRIDFPFSDKDLASYLTITPEHLSRIYHDLAKEGIILRERGVSFVTDLEKLREEAQNYRKERKKI